jgi:hypothetical protein
MQANNRHGDKRICIARDLRTPVGAAGTADRPSRTFICPLVGAAEQMVHQR